MNKKLSIFVYLAYLIIILVLSDYIIGLFYNRITSNFARLGKINLDILTNDREYESLVKEMYHPYMLWVNSPNFINRNGIKETNNLGYRNSYDFDFIPGGEVTRILALGGSTTWGYLIEDPQHTWPSKLESKLNNNSDLNKKYQVINGGLNFGTSAELLSHYVFRDRYLKPDIVILHVGGNDAGPMLFDNYNPEYTHFRPGIKPADIALRRGEKFIINNINIVKLFYAFWLNKEYSFPVIVKQSKSNNYDEDYYLKNALMNEPMGFERNMDILLRNIINDGALPIIFPFVLSSDEIYYNLEDDAKKRAKYTNNLWKGLKIALEKCMKVLKELSEKYNVLLIELDPNDIPIEFYLDHCHLSPSGESIKAEFVNNEIVKILKY